MLSLRRKTTVIDEIINKVDHLIKSLTLKTPTSCLSRSEKSRLASIDELAKRYPQEVISDEEARNIVGGDWCKITSEGYFIKTLDTILDTDVVIGSNGSSYILPKGIIGNKSTDAGATVYHGAIPRDFFEFIALNTSVEWGYSQAVSGNAILSTIHDKNNTVYYTNSGTTGVYHNHEGDPNIVCGPSPEDINSASGDDPNIKHCIYVEGSGIYVSY